MTTHNKFWMWEKQKSIICIIPSSTALPNYIAALPLKQQTYNWRLVTDIYSYFSMKHVLWVLTRAMQKSIIALSRGQIYELRLEDQPSGILVVFEKIILKWQPKHTARYGTFLSQTIDIYSFLQSSRKPMFWVLIRHEPPRLVYHENTPM